MPDDTEDPPAPQDTAPLDNIPPNHSMAEQDGESSTKYSESPDPYCDLAKLQKHFQQLKEWLTQLEPTANPHAHAKELAQLTNKLQQLTLTLQLHPTPRPLEEPLHTAMQKCTDTLYTTQWQTNLTTSLLQDTSTFDGQDSTKLEDWLTNLKMASDILKESSACLAETKSHSLAYTFIQKALQAEKCCNNIKDILHFNFFNINKHTYT